jgi:DNA mismatch endonuclease (patch repair protein)
MARVARSNTKPELTVRQIVHSLGYRFRLHRKDLPGTPDVVLPRLRAVIFVHGCFWHRHPGCKRASQPGTNVEFWSRKFSRNVERDARAIEQLEAAGWRVLIVWECETRDRSTLQAKLESFLRSNDT